MRCSPRPAPRRRSSGSFRTSWRRSMRMPSVHERLSSIGLDPVWMPAPQLAQAIDVDGERWGRAIKAREHPRGVSAGRPSRHRDDGQAQPRAGLARSLALYHGIPFRARRLARLLRRSSARRAGVRHRRARGQPRPRVPAARRAVVAVEPQPDFVRFLEALYGRDPQVVDRRRGGGRRAGRGAARWCPSARRPSPRSPPNGRDASAPIRPSAACRGAAARASR